MSGFDEAFILAAGIGSRMRPFTDHTPKPMAEIGGESLIARMIRKCLEAGVTTLFANTHHLAGMLEAHIGDKARVLHEKELLNTGYGVKKALPYLSGNPFYILNGDGWWQDGETSVFDQMASAWRDDLDILLVLQRADTMTVTPGVGDYHLQNGLAKRARDKKGDYMFTSMRLCHPRIFDDTPYAPFSFLDLMDKAESQNRLGGIELDGVWQHLSTEADIKAVNEWLIR